MKVKHIYWFAYFNISEPSVRYRASYPLKFLKEKKGVNYSIVYPGYDFRSLFQFALVFFEALFFRKSNSIIVFQKIYTHGIYATALKMLLFFRPNNTLYDIDDAEYTRRPAETIQYFMKHCSACSAGSQALVEYISNFNEKVFLLTSPVIDHGVNVSKMEGIIRVGWIGYYGAHRQNLNDLFFPALTKIDFPIRLKLLGGATVADVQEVKCYFESNRNVTIEMPLNIDWLDEQSVYESMATFDLGVSPLIDTEFNRGKSAFKLKQCLSCGVPVLASGVGENKRFLKDGENGYICNTPQEYFDKLQLIIHDHSGLYHKLSSNAKLSFHEFSVSKYSDVFLNYFNED
jgi:glycosyltransferase involved in cell wall biosynthesis